MSSPRIPAQEETIAGPVFRAGDVSRSGCGIQDAAADALFECESHIFDSRHDFLDADENSVYVQPRASHDSNWHKSFSPVIPILRWPRGCVDGL